MGEGEMGGGSLPSFFFFFVNFSPALYYLNAWNRQSYLVCSTIKSNKAPPKHSSYLKSGMKIGPRKKIAQISNHMVVPTINGAIASELKG